MSVWTDVDVYYMVFTDVFTQYGKTALMYASGGGHTGAMELLLDKKGEVSATGEVSAVGAYS